MPASRSKRSSGSDVSSKRSVPYDLTRPENKTVSQLKDELDSKGIDYPRYARKSHLITLCKRSGDSPAQWSRQKITVSPISSEMPHSLPDIAEPCIRELRHESQDATPASTTTTNAHDVNKDGSLQTVLLLSLTETVKTLSDKVNSIQTLQAPITNWCGRPDRRGYDEDSSKGAEYTLASSMSTSTNPTSPSTSNLNQASHNIDCGSQQTQCQALVAGSQLQIAPPNSSQTYGFAADSLPFVETVTSHSSSSY